MRTIRVTQEYNSRGDSFKLWNLTDLHIGAKAFDEKLFRQQVKIIADDPNAYWVGGGDYVDGIFHVNDKRYKPETLAEWCLGETDVLDCQLEYAADLIKPIAHKCKALVKGNHDDDLERYHGRNVYWQLVKMIANRGELDASQLAIGWQGFLQIPFHRIAKTGKKCDAWVLTFYLQHGYGAGRLPGSHALALGRVMSDYYADIYLLGHRHVYQFLSNNLVMPGAVTAHERRRYAWFVPSFLGSYLEPKANGEPIDTYPEKLALPSTPRGSFPIEIIPDKRKVKFTIEGQVMGNNES